MCGKTGKIFLSLSLISALTACASLQSNESPTNETSLSSNPEPASQTQRSSAEENQSSTAIAAWRNENTLSSQKIGWGQGTQTNETNQPLSCIDFQEKYGKYQALFIKEDAPNQLFLTFDEGYENGYTAQILDTLKEKEVPAIFFVTYDYAAKKPDLIQRMLAEGHIVGNHSYNHPSMPTLTPEKMEEELQKLHRYVQESFSYEMNLFRPPMGEFSEQSLAVTSNCGYTTVFWSFAYADWDVNKQPASAESLEKLTGHLHDGAIYLLHAVSKTNTEILPTFIDQARENGYNFSALEN